MSFETFPKIARLNRDIVITEKIDGTNAQVFIEGDTAVAGSRTRWITPENDNFGFARWVHENQEQLIAELGEGRHFGEWWGSGIQRGYDQTQKRFWLFNTHRWRDIDLELCDVVPVLYQGHFSTNAVNAALQLLREVGSLAAPGFMKPEGIVIFHTAASQLFKVTLEKDEKPKGQR